jgi:hypothetical protein
MWIFEKQNPLNAKGSKVFTKDAKALISLIFLGVLSVTLVSFVFKKIAETGIQE